MNERITAENLDEVLQKNKEIRAEIEDSVRKVHTVFNKMNVSSPPYLALQLLRTKGLVQMPVDDMYLSGAIFVKDKKLIPFINTALPRVNQYFTAWHELYHILFDDIGLDDHLINTENVIEERKAEYFASKMLLGNLMPFFAELPEEMDFLDKVYRCMEVFQTPYKAVLISLYETAMQTNNSELMNVVKENFDNVHENIAERFSELGLDNTLVLPSNVVDLSAIQNKIAESLNDSPELSYHKDNENYLNRVLKEIKELIGE